MHFLPTIDFFKLNIAWPKSLNWPLTLTLSLDVQYCRKTFVTINQFNCQLHVISKEGYKIEKEVGEKRPPKMYRIFVVDILCLQTFFIYCLFLFYIIYPSLNVNIQWDFFNKHAFLSSFHLQRNYWRKILVGSVEYFASALSSFPSFHL